MENENSKEITILKTEFKSFQKSNEQKYEAINNKFDEIIEQIRPQFTSYQITSFLVTFVMAMGTVMIYVTNVKSDVRNNETRISNFEKHQEMISKNYEEIQASLNAIKTDVEILKNKK